MLQSISIDTHITVTEILSGIGCLFSLIVGLMLRDHSSKIKVDVADAKAEIVKTVAKQEADLRVHIAEDKVMFEGIGRTLARLDGRPYASAHHAGGGGASGAD